MGRPLSDRELKRLSREMSGHRKDKDRARWKRKLVGQAAPVKALLKPLVEDGVSLDEPEETELDEQ